MKANSNYLTPQHRGNPDVASQPPVNGVHVDPKSVKPTKYANSSSAWRINKQGVDPNSNYLGRHLAHPKAARASKVLLSVLAKVARTMLLTIPGRWLLYEHSQDHQEKRCVVSSQTATPRWNPILQDV